MPENKTYKIQVEKLLNLKDLDAKIFDLEAEIGSFPEQLEGIRASLEGKKTAVKSAEDDYKKLQIAKNEKENEIKTKEEKVRKHESELYQIKNNKEYTALQQEIKSIKADISLLEEEVINLLDDIEKAHARCENEKKLLAGEQAGADDLINKIKNSEKDMLEKLTVLKGERGKIAAGITGDVLERYEKILKNRGRVALSSIVGEFCGECNMQLRAQIINEAKLKKNIVLCENCSRILYAAE